MDDGEWLWVVVNGGGYILAVGGWWWMMVGSGRYILVAGGCWWVVAWLSLTH